MDKYGIGYTRERKTVLAQLPPRPLVIDRHRKGKLAYLDDKSFTRVGTQNMEAVNTALNGQLAGLPVEILPDGEIFANPEVALRVH